MVFTGPETVEITIHEQLLNYVKRVNPDRKVFIEHPERVVRVARMLKAVSMKREELQSGGPVTSDINPELIATAGESFVQNAKLNVGSMGEMVERFDTEIKEVFIRIITGRITSLDLLSIQKAVEKQTRAGGAVKRVGEYTNVMVWFVRAAHCIAKRNQGSMPGSIKLPVWVFGIGLGGNEVFIKDYKFN